MISVRRFLSWLPYFFLLFLPLAHFRGHCTPTLSFRLFPFPATGLNGLFMVVWPCGCLLVPFSTFRSATAVGWTGIYPLFAFFTMDVAVRRVLYTPAALKLWKHAVNFDFCIFLHGQQISTHLLRNSDQFHQVSSSRTLPSGLGLYHIPLLWQDLVVHFWQVNRLRVNQFSQ